MASFDASKLVAKNTVDGENQVKIHSFDGYRELFEGWNDYELTETKDAESFEFKINGSSGCRISGIKFIG
jgi:hypothetical protein